MNNQNQFKYITHYSVLYLSTLIALNATAMQHQPSSSKAYIQLIQQQYLSSKISVNRFEKKPGIILSDELFETYNQELRKKYEPYYLSGTTYLLYASYHTIDGYNKPHQFLYVTIPKNSQLPILFTQLDASYDWADAHRELYGYILHFVLYNPQTGNITREMSR
jgi:hypothetical protein